MTEPLNTEAPIKKLDRLFTFCIIPATGMLVPNITGFISYHNYGWVQLASLHALFTAAAILIWQGNIILFRRTRKQYELHRLRYFRMLFYHLLTCMVNSGCIALVFAAGWQRFTQADNGFWAFYAYSALAVFTCTILINSLYELVLLRREVEHTMVRYKRMEIAKMHAELEALKAQIDPHFVFNSLNTLSYLITSRPATAKKYTETLARVYRYILMNKDKDLVFLKDELEFIRNYFYLIKIRFEESVSLDIDLEDTNEEDFLITPISLQMLIENAIKHNYFCAASPLVIHISIQSYFIIVSNRIKRKAYGATTSGIGLKNLKERFRLIMKKNIIINRDNDEFLVKVPILKV